VLGVGGGEKVAFMSSSQKYIYQKRKGKGKVKEGSRLKKERERNRQLTRDERRKLSKIIIAREQKRHHLFQEKR